MSAQPVQEHDPDDPVEILRVLAEPLHAQFLAEYYAAAEEAARRVDGYRRLHDLLRRWRLAAAAMADPAFAESVDQVREAARTGDLDGAVPIEDLVPDWSERQRRHRR
ncbi:DUF6247 family protein [Actinomadura sp. NTSP31]|uniref:DUF6247 family protein n=1 Tax=Actinomadura sp. NTSP31 TaxID=1735447 RepID=UPI0035C21CA0